MLRVLLVDDEPDLLRMVKLYLERLGYQVEAFGEAVPALDHFRSDPLAFDVVVTDLTLDGIPGDRLGMAMLESNPALRILVCSGYSFNIDSLPEPQRRQFDHLLKPFAPRMLADVVAKLGGQSS